MSSFTRKEDKEMCGGLAKLLQHLHGFLDGVAIRCALELKIADIINIHDGPVTLSQIALGINSPTLNIHALSRLMMFLVHKRIFDQIQCEEPLYSLNPSSKWLLQDSDTTIAPLAMLATDSLLLSPFYNLSKSITEGGTTMMKTFGFGLYEFFSANPNSSKIFFEGLTCMTRITMDAILSSYKFDGLKGTLVDVGGGLGAAVYEIVSAYPNLKGINFDLPHVISTAPTYEGVTHVGGDMFKALPPADIIFLKLIMHNWSDNDCVRILKNCRDSISVRRGKIVIVDIIFYPGRDDMFDDMRIAHDLMMLSFFESGKERTEVEWKMILSEAGFYRYNIIQIPAIESIIEAYCD